MKLKWSADIINGYAFKSEEFADEGIPIVRQSNLKSGKVIHDGKCYPSDQIPAKYMLRQGDICVGLSGSIENFGVIGCHDLPCALNQRVGALRVKKNKSCSGYIEYLIQSRIFKDHIASNLPSTTIVNIDASLVGNSPLPDFDLSTQRQIADFLDSETARIDLLIEKKQCLVALLGEKAKRDVSSTFERLARDNPIWRLKHVLIAGLAYGANEPSDGDDPEDVRYIRITDIDTDGNLREDTFKSLPRELIRDYILEDGDILFARSGATVGKSFIYREQLGECCYAGYLIRARVNKNLILPEFLKHFTSTDQYWNHILGTNIQATIQNVSAEKYANLAFPLPPLGVQEKISVILKNNEERYAATKRVVNTSIDRLKEYRSALITAAVTGQINVAEWNKAGKSKRQLDTIQAEAHA